MVCDEHPSSLYPFNYTNINSNRHSRQDESAYCSEIFREGADHVVTLHPNCQHDARVIPHAVGIIQLGICDVVVGNRIRARAETLAGRMPPVKYFANRGLKRKRGQATFLKSSLTPFLSGTGL